MFGSNWNHAPITLAIAALLSACAPARLDPGDVREDVGRASHRDITVAVPDILNRHGYAVRDRRETRHTIYYETDWVRRGPFADEVAEGVQECRTRIIIRARRGAANTFTVTLEAENSARSIALDARWRPLSATPMFREHVWKIATDLVMEIDAGVRVY